MRYLFFDIEGANSYDYVSKMCTFGYVIINESFEVQSKIDVIINPEAPFEKHILNEHMNAYDLEVYKSRPPFSYFYQSIKKNLEQEEQINVGWSTINDVRYIYDACKRYNLEQINYRYFDLQKAYIKIFNLENANKLEDACSQCEIEHSNVHKSDEDAYYTMLILQKLCEKEQLTLEQFFEKYEDCFSTSKEYADNAYSDEEIQEKIERRNTIYFIKTCKAKKKIFDPFIIKGKRYVFSGDIIEQEKENLKQYVQHINNAGAYCSVRLEEADVIICSPESIERLSHSSKYENVKLMTFKSFVKRIVKDA